MKVVAVPSRYDKYILWNRIFFDVILVLFVFLWVYTSVHKILEFDKFSLDLSRSPFVEKWASIVSYALPTGELILVALLSIPRTRLLGMYLSLFTISLFTGYVYMMLEYAPDLPCTCGGIMEELSWEQHLFVNGLLTILAIISILLKSTIYERFQKSSYGN